jgi:hypothetical protein
MSIFQFLIACGEFRALEPNDLSGTAPSSGTLVFASNIAIDKFIGPQLPMRTPAMLKLKRANAEGEQDQGACDVSTMTVQEKVLTVRILSLIGEVVSLFS